MKSTPSHLINGDTQEIKPDKLVFLVGPPRSGSTWLQSLLGSHPDIGTAQESHLFNHFLGPMIDAWDHMMEFDDGRGGIGLPAYLTRNEFDELLAKFSTDVFSRIPQYSRPLFLEKTPDHIRHLDNISRVFPKARTIVLLRKPEDVIESMLSAGQSWGQHWAPKSTIRAIRQYQYFFNNGAEELASSKDSAIHVCKYEQLKTQPDLVISQILDFLNLEYNKPLLADMINNPCTLKKYGEFNRISGADVVEPVGFARKQKGTLSQLQKIMVNAMLWRHRRAIGY